MNVPENWPKVKQQILNQLLSDEKKFRKSYLNFILSKQFKNANKMKNNASIITKVLSDLSNLSDEEIFKYLFKEDDEDEDDE